MSLGSGGEGGGRVPAPRTGAHVSVLHVACLPRSSLDGAAGPGTGHWALGGCWNPALWLTRPSLWQEGKQDGLGQKRTKAALGLRRPHGGSQRISRPSDVITAQVQRMCEGQLPPTGLTSGGDTSSLLESGTDQHGVDHRCGICPKNPGVVGGTAIDSL